MFCPNCGTQLPDESKFCAECGANLSASAPRPEPQPAYQQPVYQQPEPQPAYQQPAYQQPEPQPAYQQPVYQQPQPVYQAAGVAPAPAKNNKKTAIIVGAVLAVAALVIALFFLLGGKEKNGTGSVDGIIDAFNGKKFFTAAQVELLHPDFKDAAYENSDADSPAELADVLNEHLGASSAKAEIEDYYTASDYELESFVESIWDEYDIRLKPDAVYVPIGKAVGTIDGEIQTVYFDEEEPFIVIIEEDGRFYWTIAD